MGHARTECDDLIVDAILVNGTVGSGKTTLLDVLGDVVAAPHAAIDLDQLRRINRWISGDPFHHTLTVENLAALAANYRRAGAERFVLAGVVESRETVTEYAEALGVPEIFVCRLVVHPDVGRQRLRERMVFDPEGLAWHLTRHGELAGILERTALDDLVLDSSEASPLQLAHAILQHVGWDEIEQPGSGPS